MYMFTKLHDSVHEYGNSLLKIIKQLHQPVKQRDILATLHLQVSCTDLQTYMIGTSLLGIRIRIPKSNIP